MIAPGFITTDMTDALPDKIKSEVKDRVPVRRLGNPGRHRRPGLLSCRGRAQGYLTGQVIAVDGGMTA